jgi:glycosyltransferase involved in cell wall biosynthesis
MKRYNRRLLLQRLDKFQPDVLHCLCETSAPLTRWLARHLDVPYLLDVNSIVSRFRLLSLSPTRCAAIIAPAKTIADSFAASHPKFADRVRQINIGDFVETTTACFAHTDRLPGVVIAPPLDNQADLQNLFLALHRLVIDGFQFMMAIVSTGRAEGSLFKQLRSMGLLRFATVVPRLLGLYSAGSAADVFIVPRPSSSFNMLLLAAMSAGSVVAACIGGVDDLIIEGKTALTFNPDDQLSIYNCLKRIFDAPLEARQIAYEAQQHLRQSHHVSDMVASTLSLYRQTAQALLHQTKSPAA